MKGRAEGEHVLRGLPAHLLPAHLPAHLLLTYSLTHLLTHLLTYSLTHSLTYLLTYSLAGPPAGRQRPLAGYMVQGTRYRVQGTADLAHLLVAEAPVRVQGTGYRIQGTADLAHGRGPCQSDEGRTLLVVVCLAAVRAEAVARADDRHHVGAHRLDRALIKGQLTPGDARPLQQLDGALHVELGAARLEEVLG